MSESRAQGERYQGADDQARGPQQDEHQPGSEFACENFHTEIVYPGIEVGYWGLPWFHPEDPEVDPGLTLTPGSGRCTTSRPASHTCRLRNTTSTRRPGAPPTRCWGGRFRANAWFRAPVGSRSIRCDRR